MTFQPHTHFVVPLFLCSSVHMSCAVYYISTPEGAGQITFHDPRGKTPFPPVQMPFDVATPPFHGVFSHKPREGDLLLFPSFLVHSVAPSSAAQEPRISASFNIAGPWRPAFSSP